MTQESMMGRLKSNFPTAKNIEVVDLTGTSNHWEVTIECGSLQGLSRIEQHQKVMACFGPELKTGEVHALSIRTKAN